MYTLVSIFVVLAVLFLVLAVREGKKANIVNVKKLVKLSATMVGLSVFSVLVGIVAMANPEAAATAVATGFSDKSFAYLAAGIATGAASIGAGIAVGVSASAAIGAISENEKISGKALIFVAMGEGIALYGVLIAFMILNKI
jgi:V/A-type H+-transporting ATPase subunit K